eukprot:TRINITY_DN4638_c0_g1_i1.p1 TRINITY_DN4638_c0_g1~~TRINITY_DN4638_c0_g1_i1.p1  ORF type:complete len:277 (-),score=51.05 TRINITY_DN4638_c0_g1_i1:121-951(-)
MTSDSSNIIDLNVGGVLYTTSLETLTKDAGSLLCSLFSAGTDSLLHDSKGRVFIDRDGVLFRYILDFLRNGRLILPDKFQEADRLKLEAEYFQMEELQQQLECSNQSHFLSQDLLSPRKKRPSATDMSGIGGSEGYIVVGYRGTFAFGRDMSDVKFRKLTRILVHGKSVLCREVFKDTLNESRDPDRGLDGDRYTARYFLKHTMLEQAFDQLCEAGFRIVGSCASGTSAPASLQDLKPGQVTEEEQWNHYNEFIFVRKSPENDCNCAPLARRQEFF